MPLKPCLHNPGTIATYRTDPTGSCPVFGDLQGIRAEICGEHSREGGSQANRAKFFTHTHTIGKSRNYLGTIQRADTYFGWHLTKLIADHADRLHVEKSKLQIWQVLQVEVAFRRPFISYNSRSFQVDDDYVGKLQDCFGVVRSVNKSDVLTLASNFGSLKAICDASAGEMALCPGLGDKKVARIHEALHEPLVRTHSKLKRSRTEG